MKIVFTPFELVGWILSWVNRFGYRPETVLANSEQFDLDRGTRSLEDTWFWCTPIGKILWFSLTIVICGSILFGILYAFVHGVIL